MADFQHDLYLTHAEMTLWLEKLVAAHLDMAEMQAVGVSRQGRTVWCVTLCNRATGAAADKPALLMDGNNHGEEVIAMAVMLVALQTLLEGFARDEEITEPLNTRTVFIIPRLHPDGAELCLTGPYRTVGNGRYPPEEEFRTGRHPEDIDGDGRVLQMLVPDIKGEWRLSTVDNRLLIQLEPGEIGENYYRLLPEGVIRDWDCATFPIERPRHGNLNRQFPAHWAPEYAEYGAGELPLVEPEAQALARFVVDHPNITGVLSYHSHGDIAWRPSSTTFDAELDPDDLDTFRTIGAVGTRLTSYPVLSTFESFTADKRNPRHGAFTVELWNVERQVRQHKGQYFVDAADDEKLQGALLAWADSHAPTACKSWTPVEHPQLGTLLVGGWDPFLIHRNAPPAFIRQVAEPNVRFAIRHALASPKLTIDRLEAVHIEGGVYRIDAVITNGGNVPTHVTRRGLEADPETAVSAILSLPEGTTFVAGAEATRLGHLAGRNTRRIRFLAPVVGRGQSRCYLGHPLHRRIAAHYVDRGSSPSRGRPSNHTAIPG